MAKKPPAKKTVETLTHDADKRKNIPTAEFQSVVRAEQQDPVRVAYERRNRDLDPQLVWRGKDERDWSDLVVDAPPLYIQEKVHPKVLIDDLLRVSPTRKQGEVVQFDLFADFNGIPLGVDRTDFYQHDQNWSNRMILGDSLQVMASLAEREGLRGKVQCIYLDPPYGIKFNSNFQWSTTRRDVKDGKADHITREPAQVKAFRDTWRDGIHSYLTYLRDRFEYLYDKPYPDNKKVRVAGPFTVESLSPHRVLGVDENDELIDPLARRASEGESPSLARPANFEQMILDNLKTAGVRQAHKEDRITFTALTPWPGKYVCAEGRYREGEAEKRAAVLIGPEFGTVQRQGAYHGVQQARPHPVLKARMNADLHMAGDLKNTGKGNLFVIFGEPDITIVREPDERLRVKVNGVDVFHPNTGEVRSDGANGIACWFIDTDYNDESFFVRHAYFLGANDPYSALKTTLKAEINAEAWASLHSDTSRPSYKPMTGRIAVKVINHLSDEVMKVLKTG